MSYKQLVLLFNKTVPTHRDCFVEVWLRGPDLHGRLKVMSPDISGYFSFTKTWLRGRDLHPRFKVMSLATYYSSTPPREPLCQRLSRRERMFVDIISYERPIFG